MKQLIGNHRYFYNEGIKYLHSLPRGFFIPEKGSLKAANYIKYENEYFLVETGGKYAFGIIPKYDTNKKQINQTNFIAIRQFLKANIPKWFKDGKFPAHTVDQAAREVASNFKSIIERRKIDRKKFQMKFKSKRNSVTETITLEGSSLGRKGVYSSVFKGIDTRLYTKEPIDITSKKEYKICYNRNNYKFHISLPISIKQVKKSQFKKEWCSIDPGEKTFATIYNPFDREVLFVANNTRKNCDFNDTTIDKLKSKISKNKNKKSLKKAMQNAIEKDKNKRKDLHHKLANYLCSNFKHIIVPKYGVKNMKVNSTVNRSMRNLGFYQFLMFLKHKCREHETKLYIVDEHFTSQACCGCGKLNKPKDREYKCLSCNIDINRDANGAVNIALKHLKSRTNN